MNSDELVKLELLCFLQQKSKIMTFGDLVSICTDFCNSDEVRWRRLLCITMCIRDRQRLKALTRITKQLPTCWSWHWIQMFFYLHLLQLIFLHCHRWELITWMCQLSCRNSHHYVLKYEPSVLCSWRWRRWRTLSRSCSSVIRQQWSPTVRWVQAGTVELVESSKLCDYSTCSRIFNTTVVKHVCSSPNEGRYNFWWHGAFQRKKCSEEIVVATSISVFGLCGSSAA